MSRNITQTNWDNLVCDKEIATVLRQRSKTYVTEKVFASALEDYKELGWELAREYKNPKYVLVKMNKPYYEQFEDRVWQLFAKMGFSHMNSDRNFAMSYDYNNPELTQQIDVFAADEECVIIVECKSADRIKEVPFKKELEALHGQMDGLRKEALKKFPKRKVKFVWATQNIILSKMDKKRMNEWGIIHFGDAAVSYYHDLIKHLGVSAKYQLLGNLFANTEIRNMDNRIPAIQGRMGNHTYYSFSIEPERLLKIGYVLHRNEANKNMMPTYQRLIKKNRLVAVRKFVEEGGYFPNSLIISIDNNGKDLQFDLSPTKIDGCISKLGILHLPKKYRSAYIIDGQHRLYGYSGSKYASTNSIPVVAFVDLDRQEQIKTFMDINENQKAVPKTLRVTLNADMLWDSDDYNERRQALRSKIAQMLAEEETSPLLGRIVVGEDEKNDQKSITVEALQQALKRCNYFSTFGKKNVITKAGSFDVGENQSSCDLFYPFLEECLKYIKLHTAEEWEKTDKDGTMITMNRGIQAIIRVINDIVDYLISTDSIDPKNDATERLVQAVCFYLDPLIDYLNGINSEQRKELRSIVGGGGDKRFWRAYQKAIADVRMDFKPEGLEEYLLNEAKTFNLESAKMLHEIEKTVKAKIENALIGYYGDIWLIRALPKQIYDRAKKEADDQNYESIRNGDTQNTVSIWSCVTLAECKTIATSGNHWTAIFDDLLTRPDEDESAKTKDAKTEWLHKLYTITNKLKMNSYSVPIAEYEFIKSIHKWLLG